MFSRLPKDRTFERADEKYIKYSSPVPHLLQAQQALALLYAKVAGCPGTGSYPAPSPSPTTQSTIMGWEVTSRDELSPSSAREADDPRWCEIRQSICPIRCSSGDCTVQSIKASQTKLFADDSLLFKVIRNDNDTALLQQDLSALKHLEKTWQMSFNPTKCIVLRISPKKNVLCSIDTF